MQIRLLFKEQILDTYFGDLESNQSNFLTTKEGMMKVLVRLLEV
jgi:hypothetical protein